MVAQGLGAHPIRALCQRTFDSEALLGVARISLQKSWPIVRSHAKGYEGPSGVLWFSPSAPRSRSKASVLCLCVGVMLCAVPTRRVPSEYD